MKMRMRMRVRVRMTITFSFSFKLTFLVDSYFVFFIFFLHNIKMSYYWYNRQEICKKQKKNTLKKSC